MRAFVGIDLGTTYSAIAVASGDREPVVIRNREGQSTTPSAVAMRDGVAIVGQEAKEAIGAGPVSYTHLTLPTKA